jgi:hypothetical protein
MADLPTLPGTAVAFTEYLPSASRSPDGEIAILGGGILRAIRGGTAAEMKLPSLQTHYGYLAEGTLEITCMDCTITVPEGFYFSLPCAAHVRMRRDRHYHLATSLQGLPADGKARIRRTP